MRIRKTPVTGVKMDNKDDFTLVQHLTELRIRIVYSLIAVGVTSILAWNFSELIFEIVRRPILPYLPQGGLVFTAPMDKFMAHLKVSVLAGIVMACPIWIFQLWKFIAPGLYRQERKYGLYFIFFGSVLFLTGISFVYLVVYPAAFSFLLTFGGEVDRAMITINDYLSFFMTTTLVFGVAFELPLVLTIMGIMGVVTKDLLKNLRRYAMVIICILSAVLTPPDPMSMVLLVVPLYTLYELSIFLVGVFGTKPE